MISAINIFVWDYIFFSFFVEEILSLFFIRLHCMKKCCHIDDFLHREAVCMIGFC